ncbi:hypothetical protein SNEBB_007708 [Seison nebaliae]|nr:hypothetical protein SNEBB_007708 [Seison nebaliae]
MAGIFEKEDKNVVCFGSAQNRPIFPSKLPLNHLGIKNNSTSRVLPIGPGDYQNLHKLSFLTEFDKRLPNGRGYGFGNRSAKARLDTTKRRTEVPGPTNYQKLEYSPTDAPCFRPFNMASSRFPTSNADSTPGPGHFEYNVLNNRHLSQLYDSSFGGKKVLNKHYNPTKSDIDLRYTPQQKRKFLKKYAYFKMYEENELPKKLHI